MADRWSIKALNETSDMLFIRCILQERYDKLNPNAPLARKLVHCNAALYRLEQTSSPMEVQKIVENLKKQPIKD